MKAICIKPRHSFVTKGKVYDYTITSSGDYRIIDDGGCGNTMSKDVFKEHYKEIVRGD